ncbi:hypothetical protein CV102_16320 [Natronococcus pandeyae]|uniref:Uncharacterized protein n=1 Tax=Natronococcus pandeyae TaxID=2055836 RepID=A0A8J8Q319_9EURY|nr:hypothetical protein [Natronococcus pandeyae]TYL37533.1 hypothetical protein CV102_16320 [Natronococcus pandeyae]
MAREPSVLDTERSVESDDEHAESTGNTGLLDRRSYMRLAGATTAAAAFTGIASANAEEYEVIEANGQTIQIGQGETFENKLIDLSTGNGILLNVTGSDAVIRNVGFEGLYRGDGFMISINTNAGDVLVENVYLGDGSTKEGESFVHGPGAVFMHRNSNADATFRNCNVQGWPNNGFYCSNTAHGGSVRFESCFGKNNGVSTFRCASGNDEIVDCVAYNDNTDYGDGYGNFSETDGRPVWVWNGGTVTVRDSHFAAGSYPHAFVAGANGSAGNATVEGGAIGGNVQNADGSSVNIADSVSSEPDLSVPEGVPTSAEEAAAGGGSQGSGRKPEEGDTESDDTLSNVLLVDGDASDVTRYEFVVDGEIEPSNAEGATIDDGLEIDDGVVHGTVADWLDAFRFDGELEQVTVDGPATVLLNDEEIDPDEYGPELPHVLEVEGTGTATSYEITVDGTIELESDDDPEADATTISGSTVQSSVTEETQMYRFSGALTDVTFTEGEATVRLDDEKIDPDEYGDQELLPHALVIDGTDADGPSTYSFEASGAVVESDCRTASIDEADLIEGEAVRAVVDNWADVYWFDGEIEAFRLVGHATVDVQHNARNQ